MALGGTRLAGMATATVAAGRIRPAATARAGIAVARARTPRMAAVAPAGIGLVIGVLGTGDLAAMAFVGMPVLDRSTLQVAAMAVASVRLAGIGLGDPRAGSGDTPATHRFDQGVGGVGVGRLTATCRPSLAEQAVPDGIEGRHDLGPDLGVVAHPQVPGPVSVGEGPQRPTGMDAPPPGLGILAGGLDPDAVVSQLGQRR